MFRYLVCLILEILRYSQLFLSPTSFTIASMVQPYNSWKKKKKILRELIHLLNNMSNKANLRDLIAATGLVILLKLDSNRLLISPCDLEIWWMISKTSKAPLLYYVKLCAPFQIHQWIQTRVTVRKPSIRVKIGDFLCDLKIWCMTLKNNRLPFLYDIKLIAAFQSHWCIRSGVTVWKRSIRVKIDDFLSGKTLKFDGWPWKTIGHLFYTTLSFVQHFKAIGIFKLELQSRNAQLGSKLAIFPRDLENWGMTLKTIGHLSYAASSFVASFHNHWWIQTGVTVRKHPIWVKISNFFPVWPWNLTDDLEKQ